MLDDIPMSRWARRQWERLSLDDKILLRLAFAQAFSNHDLVSGVWSARGRYGGRRYTVHHIRIGLCEFQIAECSSGQMCLFKFFFTSDYEALAAE